MKLVNISEKHYAGKHLAVLVLELDIEESPGVLSSLDTSECPASALQATLDSAAAVQKIREVEAAAAKKDEPAASSKHSKR